MNPYLLLIVAYLLGSIPSSDLVSRYGYGVDLTRRGSGNLGATNVFRVLGWRAALPVLTADVAKGWLPAWLFFQIDGRAAWAWALAYGGAAILGHVFPVWKGFRGGKGVATSTGVLLAVAPLALLAGVVVWLLVAFGTRIVSVASMAAALAVVAGAWILPGAGPPGEGLTELRAFTFALAVFVFWAHRANIGRLLRGEENRFGASSDDGSTESSAANPGGSPGAPEDREPTR